MFHQGELRMLAGAVALFLLGTGWRVADASTRLPPLSVDGKALEWTPPAALPSQEAGGQAVESTEAAHASPRPSPKRSFRSDPLNVNQATSAQLETLPGVGPALSKRIIEARAIAPLQSLADLDRVKGLGPAKLEKIRTLITF